MKKRLYSWILVIALIFTIPTSIMAAEQTNEAIAQIAINRNKDLVQNLGFLSDIAPDDEITYADYAKFLLNASGIMDAGADEESVNECKKLGYFFSTYTTKLKPSDTITYREALYGGVQVLGYGKIYTGENYLAGAGVIGLMDDIEADLDTALTGNVFYTLAYNLFDAEYLAISGIDGEGNTTHYRNDGITILSEHHKIYNDRGRILANGNTGMYAASSLKKDTVQINGLVFKEGQTNAEELLGHEVEFYYRTDSKGTDAVLLYVESVSSKVVVIDPDDVDVSKSTLTSLVYFEGDKEKRVSIKRNAAFIYNGVAKDDINKSIFDFESGDITVVDDDFVSIRSYETYWVRSLDTENYVIYPYYYPSIEADPNGQTNLNVVDSEGNRAFVIDIKAYDVISVMRNGDSMTIIRSNKTVNGTVEAINTNGGKTTVTIGGKDYAVSESFLNTTFSGKPEIVLGMTARFFLTAFGEIYGLSTASYGNYEVGYIVDVGSEGSFGECKAKIWDPVTMKFEIFDFAKKVTFDDSTSVTEANVRAMFADTNNEFKDGNNFERQLIRYAVNDKNEITKIDLPSDGEDDTQGEATLKRIYNYSDREAEYRASNDPYGTMSITEVQNAISLFYRSQGKNMSGKVLVGGAAIYQMSSKEEAINEKLFGKGSITDQQRYLIEAYSMSQSGITADYLLLFPVGTGKIPSSSRFFLINGMTRKLNADGDAATVLTGTSISRAEGDRNAALSLEVENGLDISQLEEGDIIDAKLNALGVMIEATIIYDHSAKKLYSYSGSTYNWVKDSNGAGMYDLPEATTFESSGWGSEYRWTLVSVKKIQGTAGIAVLGANPYDDTAKTEMVDFSGYYGITAFDESKRDESSRTYSVSASDLRSAEYGPDFDVVVAYSKWGSVGGAVCYRAAQ